MRHSRHHHDDNLKDFFADVPLHSRKTFPMKAQLMVLSIFLLVIFGTGVIPKLTTYFDEQENSQAANVQLLQESDDSSWNESESSSFDSINLIGEAAFVYDVNAKKVIYEKNPDTKLPLASITKLMTALVAYEIVSEDTTVPITFSAVLQDGDSGLKGGDRFDLASLMEWTLTNSSNDGAYAMAAAAGSLLNSDKPATSFVEAMNIRAEELGLTQMEFKNPTGLDVSETEAGALGSARDVAFLMDYILKNQPQILETTINPKVAIADNAGATHTAENTNELIGDIPGLIGSKTGYTTLAGGNLTIAFDASLNRPVIIVVLGSSRNGRFTDVAKLVKATRQQIN